VNVGAETAPISDVGVPRTKIRKSGPQGWPAARIRRSIPFVANLNNAILFNWSIALGAWALGGPLWAAVVFLLVALARVSLESQSLRNESSELRRRLTLTGGPFGLTGYSSGPDEDTAPESHTRLVGGGTVPGSRAVPRAG
jgi:hypothetical protein